MHFLHRSDHSGANRIDAFAQTVVVRPLIAHLRRNLVLGGGHAKLAGFPHIVSQRLLRVDVLAHLDRLHRGDRVRVVGGRG